MTSELMSLTKLEEQLAVAEHPGLEHLQELAARVAAGATKIEKARASRADSDKIKAAQQKLDELQAELSRLAVLEMHWYALYSVHSILRDFKVMPCVPANARMALVVPDVVELKVRLDGTDHVPF